MQAGQSPGRGRIISYIIAAVFLNANDAMRNMTIDACIEAICRNGCQEVRRKIQLLEQGQALPELSHLRPEAQQAVLDELKSIMSVYTDSCSV